MNRIDRIVEIVEGLQEWIVDRDGLSSTPVASFTYTPYTEEVGIGDYLVWDSENGYCDEHDEEDLSLEGCKTAFLPEVDSLRPFFDESAGRKEVVE